MVTKTMTTAGGICAWVLPSVAISRCRVAEKTPRKIRWCAHLAALSFSPSPQDGNIGVKSLASDDDDTHKVIKP